MVQPTLNMLYFKYKWPTFLLAKVVYYFHSKWYTFFLTNIILQSKFNYTKIIITIKEENHDSMKLTTMTVRQIWFLLNDVIVVVVMGAWT